MSRELNTRLQGGVRGQHHQPLPPTVQQATHVAPTATHSPQPPPPLAATRPSFCPPTARGLSGGVAAAQAEVGSETSVSNVCAPRGCQGAGCRGLRTEYVHEICSVQRGIGSGAAARGRQRCIAMPADVRAPLSCRPTRLCLPQHAPYCALADPLGIRSNNSCPSTQPRLIQPVAP